MIPEEFWNQDDRHRDQKFYVGFCLLESALGDYAIARDLHCHNKLNWASTTYYYSLVHALRLVCFIPEGDFPTGHRELAKLYKDGAIGSGRMWLRQFIRNREASRQGVRTQIGQTDFRREYIARYFEDGGQVSSALNKRLKAWGEILDKARECRNDSNYEGLIIAHEHIHRLVTGDFNQLANVLCKICESTLPEAVLLFKHFIDAHPRRDYWYFYLNWRKDTEGLCYLENSLKFRLLGESNVWCVDNSNQNPNLVFDIQNGNAIVNTIFEWLNPLRKNNTNTIFAEEVLENIRLGTFNEKGLLMQSFRNQINELERIFEGGYQ